MWDQIEISRTVRLGEVEHAMTVRFPAPRFAHERNAEVTYWTEVVEKILREAGFSYQVEEESPHPSDLDKPGGATNR